MSYGDKLDRKTGHLKLVTDEDGRMTLNINGPEMMSAALADLITADAKFWGILATNLTLVEVEVNHPYFQTAATDGENLYYNPLFMHLIGHEGRKFVIAHEVAHIIMMTLDRMGYRDPKLWNYATDYANNLWLSESSTLKMPTAGDIQTALDEMIKLGAVPENQGDRNYPEPEKVVGLLDHKYSGMAAEEIYEVLKEQQEKEGDLDLGTLDQHVMTLPKEEKDKCNGKGDNSDGKGKFTQIGDGHGAPDMKKLAQRWKAIITNAATKCRGSVPAGLDRLLREIHEPKVNWRDVITLKILTSKPKDYAWIPPERRFFGMGMTLPAIQADETVRVACIVDTSGSIGEHEMRDFVSEIYGICSQFTSFEMLVMTFDHDIYNAQIFNEENKDDLLTYDFKGGGGTYFQTSLDWLAGEHGVLCEGKTIQDVAENGEQWSPDTVIFFTDGYGEGWCEKYKGYWPEFVWLINTDCEPSWGTHVRYDYYH